MIFNNNTTSLVDNVVMAEGYDGSCGAALALIESARSDYAMFRAMLDVDARELQIQRESTGYVAEGEVTALTESAISGIWNKIKEFFKKLAAKIKSIFHTFISKIDSLYKSDKQMVKKYQKELYRKSNLGNLEVDWVKFDDYNAALNIKDYALSQNTDWKEEAEDREKFYLPDGVSDMDNLEEDLDDKYADGGDSNKEELKDIGGIGSICMFLDGYEKNIRELNKRCNNLIRTAEKVVREVDKYSGSVAKSYGSKDATYTVRTIMTDDDPINADRKTVSKKDVFDGRKADDADMKIANHAYDMAIAYQNVVLRVTRWVLDTNKKEYKQNKAAFMKAISANNDKLKESAIYLDAVAEAAAEEVESVISGALSKEELSKICNASLNVKDADVSDDPDKLTYGPDYYSDNQSYVRTDGSIDTEINSKSESAFFGQLLY